MQVCTSLQTDNHTSIPPVCFYRPDALPAAQPTASKHSIILAFILVNFPSMLWRCWLGIRKRIWYVCIWLYVWRWLICRAWFVSSSCQLWETLAPLQHRRRRRRRILHSCQHRCRIDKYLDTLLANQTVQTVAKSCSRKMADWRSYY